MRGAVDDLQKSLVSYLGSQNRMLFYHELVGLRPNVLHGLQRFMEIESKAGSYN